MGEKTYSASEAKDRFSEVLRHVREGETVTVTYRGEPVAEVRPLRPEPNGDLPESPSDDADEERRIYEEKWRAFRAGETDEWPPPPPVKPRTDILERYFAERAAIEAEEDANDPDYDPAESRIEKLRRRGVLQGAKGPFKPIEPIAHVPGALERFLADRNRTFGRPPSPLDDLYE